MQLLFKQRLFSWFDSYDIYAVNTKKAKLVSYHVPRAEAESMSGMLVKRSITMRSVRPGLP